MTKSLSINNSSSIKSIKYIILTIITTLLFILDILWGMERINYSDILCDNTFSNTIIFDFRIPRAITSILVGVALSVSGLLMQTIFRNPMAGPYILGVSSGASLGVALFMLAGSTLTGGLLQQLGVASSAWIGSSIVLIIVMIISIRLKDIMAILILGMMIGSATTAFIDILQLFSGDTALKGFVIWAMGSTAGVSNTQIVIMCICVLIGLFITMMNIKNLDIMLLGDNYARVMGLHINRFRIVIFLATALLAGSVTAFCGPIAFIGIAAPHIARITIKRASHRELIPASVLIGAIMMLLCDILSNIPFSNIVLPINTIASLMGIPIVVMVVINRGRSRFM